eukprot:2592058-Pleurochrysis_carterae.AAC.1
MPFAHIVANLIVPRPRDAGSKSRKDCPRLQPAKTKSFLTHPKHPWSSPLPDSRGIWVMHAMLWYGSLGSVMLWSRGRPGDRNSTSPRPFVCFPLRSSTTFQTFFFARRLDAAGGAQTTGP